MFEVIGWLGSALFCLCGLPQAWHSYKNKNSHGVTWAFLWMWFFGEILTFIYVLPSMMLPLLLNYAINFLFLLVILWYKFRPEFEDKNGS